MLIGDIPRRNAKLYPKKAAVVENDIEINFYDLNRRVNRLANALSGFGLKKGDKVAVLNNNCYQYVELYFALAKAGTPVVPLNYRSSKEELTYILNHSEARMLIFGNKYSGMVEDIKGEASDIKRYVCIDSKIPGAENYEDMIGRASEAEPDVQLDEDDGVVLGYTGGTTGLPKGVVTTHKNIVTSCYNCALEIMMPPDSVYLNAPPMFHAGDAMGMFGFSFVGATNVVMGVFSPEDVLKNIQKHRVTHPLFVPAMIMFILQFPEIDKYDTSSLDTILYGTAPMPIKPLKKAMEVFGCKFLQVYGSTETFVPISMLKPEDHVLEGSQEDFQRMESAGREVIGVEVRVVNNDDRDVKTGKIGEIVVRGNNVMKEYWRAPELTEGALRNSWYHTGDMGMMDDENYIFIVDRKKDMIISGGENIYPKEIENLLLRHPAVQETAVIGVPHDVWGEEVKALVIKKESAELTEEELIEYCKGSLPGYKCPRSFEFRKEFPRSSAGKVLKKALREEYWKAKERKL